MIFSTFKEAEDKYYENHDCQSDDRDVEEGRIMRWLESNSHVVEEDNPDTAL